MKNRSVLSIVSMLLMVILLSQSITIPTFAEKTTENYDGATLGLGALEETEEPTVVAPSRSRASLPSSVDLSEDIYFPSIASQGSLGSCGSWATTYYQFTYEMAKLEGWNAKENLEYVASPKWTYNYANGDANSGTTISGNYNVLKSSGAAKWSEFPYVGSTSDSLNYLEWCTDVEVARQAAKIRVSDYSYQSFASTSVETPITSYNDTDLNNIKTYLSNGHPLTFSTDFYTWDTVTVDSYGKVVIRQINDNNQRDGHALTIVGYDDNLSYDLNQNGTIEDFEKGALKIANSWGTSYGNSGYIWVMYDALNKVSNAENLNSDYRNPIIESYAYYTIEVAEYDTSSRVEITLNSSSRREITSYLAYPTISYIYPLYMSASSSAAGVYGFDGSTNAVDCTFVVDMDPGDSLDEVWGMYVADKTSNGVYTTVKQITVFDDNEAIQTITPNESLDGTNKIFYTGDLEPIVATSLKMTYSGITFTAYKGATYQIKYTIAPSNATCSWSSSDTSVATVDSTGTITVVGAGKTTITATTSNGLTASCTLTTII